MIKKKSPPFSDSSKPIWYLRRSEWKNSLIIKSVLLPIIIHFSTFRMHSLFFIAVFWWRKTYIFIVFIFKSAGNFVLICSSLCFGFIHVEWCVPRSSHGCESESLHGRWARSCNGCYFRSWHGCGASSFTGVIVGPGISWGTEHEWKLWWSSRHVSKGWFCYKRHNK